METVSEGMLEEAVSRALSKMSRPEWRPPTMTIEDLRQEAWVAVLEAARGGVTGVEQLARIAKNRLNAVVGAEASRPEVPWDDVMGEDGEFVSD